MSLHIDEGNRRAAMQYDWKALRANFHLQARQELKNALLEALPPADSGVPTRYEDEKWRAVWKVMRWCTVSIEDFVHAAGYVYLRNGKCNYRLWRESGAGCGDNRRSASILALSLEGKPCNGSQFPDIPDSITDEEAFDTAVAVNRLNMEYPLRVFSAIPAHELLAAVRTTPRGNDWELASIEAAFNASTTGNMDSDSRRVVEMYLSLKDIPDDVRDAVHFAVRSAAAHGDSLRECCEKIESIRNADLAAPELIYDMFHGEYLKPLVRALYPPPP